MQLHYLSGLSKPRMIVEVEKVEDVEKKEMKGVGGEKG